MVGGGEWSCEEEARETSGQPGSDERDSGSRNCIMVVAANSVHTSGLVRVVCVVDSWGLLSCYTLCSHVTLPFYSHGLLSFIIHVCVHLCGFCVFCIRCFFPSLCGSCMDVDPLRGWSALDCQVWSCSL